MFEQNGTWEAILDADKRYVWHPYASAVDAPTVFPVVSAQGVRLALADGRELIHVWRFDTSPCR
jgi:adenosylmethionine-8-amino-7-oxononanoate aminotransferase